GGGAPLHRGCRTDRWFCDCSGRKPATSCRRAGGDACAAAVVAAPFVERLLCEQLSRGSGLARERRKIKRHFRGQARSHSKASAPRAERPLCRRSASDCIKRLAARSLRRPTALL